MTNPTNAKNARLRGLSLDTIAANRPRRARSERVGRYDGSHDARSPRTDSPPRHPPQVRGPRSPPSPIRMEPGRRLQGHREPAASTSSEKSSRTAGSPKPPTPSAALRKPSSNGRRRNRRLLDPRGGPGRLRPRSGTANDPRYRERPHGRGLRVLDLIATRAGRHADRAPRPAGWGQLQESRG